MNYLTALKFCLESRSSGSSQRSSRDASTKSLWQIIILSCSLVYASALVSDYEVFVNVNEPLNCTGTHVNNCVLCLPGTFANEEKPLCGCCPEFKGKCQGVEDCTDCAAGFFQPEPGQVSCVACPRGQSTENQEKSLKCTPCTPGHFAKEKGTPECRPCPEGSATNQTGQEICRPCKKGHFTNSTGKTTCSPCKPGHFCSAEGCSECEVCPKGTYTNKTASPLCTRCWLGSNQPKKGQKTCVGCPAGFESRKEGAKNCTGCRPGMFKNESSFDLCADCPPGFNASQANSTFCGECPKGHYQNEYGQAQCNLCPRGSFCDQKGCVGCTACPPGEEARTYGADNCTLCLPGTFKDIPSTNLCKKCASGFYNINFGQTSCIICPQRYFCPQADHLPLPCSPGSYCPAGSTSMRWCSSPFFKVDQSSGCVPTAEFIALVASVSVVVFIIVAAIAVNLVRSYRLRPGSSGPKVEKSERQPLTCTEENSMPVYAGL